MERLTLIMARHVDVDALFQTPTEKGEEQGRHLGRFVARIAPGGVDHALIGRAHRMEETFTMVADEIGYVGEVKPVDELTEGYRGEYGLAQGLGRHMPADAKTVMCVTHDFMVTGHAKAIMPRMEVPISIPKAGGYVFRFEADNWGDAANGKVHVSEIDGMGYVR